jgi:uncharacterized membrane-anchored protein YhcB (DUF1043 family)
MTYDDWDLAGMVVLAGIFVGMLLVGLFSKPKQPFQTDWVADRQRKIARNGFKSRMGAR